MGPLTNHPPSSSQFWIHLEIEDLILATGDNTRVSVDGKSLLVTTDDWDRLADSVAALVCQRLSPAPVGFSPCEYFAMRESVSGFVKAVSTGFETVFDGRFMAVPIDMWKILASEIAHAVSVITSVSLSTEFNRSGLSHEEVKSIVAPSANRIAAVFNPDHRV